MYVHPVMPSVFIIAFWSFISLLLAVMCFSFANTSQLHVFLFCFCFSPGFLRFVNVLVNMSAEERKSFLQFTTGCSSLPPGGLANLYPRLTVVRKVDAGEGSYPSVNTCVHYLKLPDYPTEEILRERLLTATREKGFHLNWYTSHLALFVYNLP